MMPGKNMSFRLLTYALAVVLVSSEPYSSDEEFSNTGSSTPVPSMTFDITATSFEDEAIAGFVNCEHVQRLLNLDGSMFDLGQALDKCWHHGVTLDELRDGLNRVEERPDIEKYSYEDLYLACDDVFGRNLSKITTRLLQDYLSCQTAQRMDLKIQSIIERRFADIIEVYTIGNMSTTIDEETLVSCANTTKRVTILCRHYGLTEDQWRRGFLRYHYVDKWAVEEDVSEMSLTCDQVFNARLQELVYQEPVEMFIKCQRSLPIEPEIRDYFEKKYAQKLMEYRAQESTGASGVDLRDYVSCGHLLPQRVRNRMVSASWSALNRCETRGIDYVDLQQGVEDRIHDDDNIPGRWTKDETQLAERYIGCESVFNEELWSFTTALLNDYEACKEAGRVNETAKRAIGKRFAKLFRLLAAKKPTLRANVTEGLVHCAQFTSELAELCRLRGSTLAQEIRGLGSLARRLGDSWLNAEPLDRLYLRCEDLFDEYAKHMRDIPVDQYMQCRWDEKTSEAGRAFIDKRIAGLYKNKHKWNGTRYRGDADVEITSFIVLDQGTHNA